MNVLIIGGTRYFGKHLVYKLLQIGHEITIATRGKAKDDFGDSINRIIVERTDYESIKKALENKHFDVICDNLAYCSNDVKYLLDNIVCNKYIMTSTTAVYNKHIDIKESDFNPLEKELIWCNRSDYSYDEIKQQAEIALFQKYKNVNSIAVRFPYVVGKDDYTNRLYFYVKHIIKCIPMSIDNINSQMSFIRSDEAGFFLAFLVDNNYVGTINGSSEGTISIKDISEYIKTKTGKSILISTDGEKAPYNGENEYSINTDKARKLGFSFTHLDKWIYSLLDYYIEKASTE